jgi:hypothetical protein
MNAPTEAMMQLLLIDDELSPTFERADLQLHSDWVVRRASTLADFGQPRKADESPIDLIVAFQDRPKQFSQAELSRCIDAQPLLRMMVVQGPWCDGDVRTPGRVFGPHVMRFDAAELHLAEMIEDFRVGKGVLAQPLTAQAESPIFSADSKRRLEGFRIGISLPGQLSSGAAACVELLGHEAVVFQNGDQTAEGLDLLLVDGDSESPDPLSSPTIPRLRLCGFSRREDHSALNKTYSLADLAAAIEQKMQPISGAAKTREFPISL